MRGSSYSITYPFAIDSVKMGFLSFYFLVAILLWIGGYFMTSRGISTTNTTLDDLEEIISPPKWLYYLCGAPKSKKYPIGTMRVIAFQSQMGGISLGLFLVLSFLSKPSTLANVVGFALSVLFAQLLVSYVSKHYGSRNRPANRKRRK